jgi:hypothetical protein
MKEAIPVFIVPNGLRALPIRSFDGSSSRPEIWIHPDFALANAQLSDLAFHEKAGRCQALLWLGKFISDVFLCPDIRRFVSVVAVKAERSEFILSLEGRRRQPY